jgi:hypothetical protein
VLMQLLVGMLDASLARPPDLLPAERRVAVALKIDEAPLVLNRGFAETMALKRSAGLETVACWQTDAQWVEREVRDQLDALFAHRVYFATASARDARDAVTLTMSEFSDSVRPGIGRLSTLGRPDVRLHLPKHHAIVSWSTAAGRQTAFVAQTIPLSVDQRRLAAHTANQHERGGRHLADLRQPHWDRPQAADAPPPAKREHVNAATEPAMSNDRAAGKPAPIKDPEARKPIGAPLLDLDSDGRDGQPILPATPADSYRELVELDRTQSFRWGRRASPASALEPDRLDLEILALVASLRHVLSTQIHRRFNTGRAATTTQRRLKRLADAGLLERFQFHRRDGGGVPMCCVISADGLTGLEAAGLKPGGGTGHAPAPHARSMAREEGERRLRQARHDVHVAGWALALARSLGGPRAKLRGAEESVLSPPQRSSPQGRAALAPGELRLPGGLTPHDFLRTDTGGQRVEVERFETVRPDAIVQGGAVDVLIELDDRLPRDRAVAKLERYDHFLAGWSIHTQRYGQRTDVEPVVVFVCRDRKRARECARAADVVLLACRAYAGEYPFDWEYPGRAGVRFVAERDAHEGLLCGYGVPRLPPAVRVAAAHGDPIAGETAIERRDLPGALLSPSGQAPEGELARERP